MPVALVTVVAAGAEPEPVPVTAGAAVMGMTPTPPDGAVVKSTWGTVMVVLMVTLVLELGMTSPASLVQGTTVVTSTTTVV